MHTCYDEDFVEAAVFTAASGKRRGVPSLQIRRFHTERERCYHIVDPDDRNAAFFKVHLAWFREWGLETLLLDLRKEYPLIAPSLNTLAFRKARATKDEAAELYVSAENGRSGIVAMRPERFERDEAVRRFLRHEFMHLSDMVDPAFEYTPDLRARGIDPARQRMTRERYRLLWDITIDGRLERLENRERHQVMFQHAFGFWTESQRVEVFSSLWMGKSPRHDALLVLAADPRDASRAEQPMPGGRCPLCGFSTFEWAEAAALEETVRMAIQRDFPTWSPESGACLRCAEVFAAAGRYADALPQ